MNRNTIKALLPMIGMLLLAGAMLTAAAHWGGDLPQRTDSKPALIPLLPAWLFNFVLILLAACFVASFALFVVVLARGAGGMTGRIDEETRRLIGLLLLGFVFLFVLYVVFAFLLSLLQIKEESAEQLPLGEGGESELEEEEIPPDLVSEPPEETLSPEPDGDTGRIVLLVLGGFLSVAAALVATGVIRRILSTPPAVEEESPDRLVPDLRLAAHDILSRMLKEPDHRLAVIAAYALVEDVFARHGYPRRPYQTPLEYMDGTLAFLRSVPGKDSGGQSPEEEIMELTRLYEIAKFSRHAVGTPERTRAVTCLERIRTKIPAPGVDTEDPVERAIQTDKGKL